MLICKPFLDKAEQYAIKNKIIDYVKWFPQINDPNYDLTPEITEAKEVLAKMKKKPEQTTPAPKIELKKKRWEKYQRSN